MTVFRAAILRTFFFVFHAGAKELNGEVGGLEETSRVVGLG